MANHKTTLISNVSLLLLAWLPSLAVAQTITRIIDQPLGIESGGYWFGNVPVGFRAAQAQCQSIGGMLAEPDTTEKQNALYQATPSFLHPWVNVRVARPRILCPPHPHHRCPPSADAVVGPLHG